MKDWKFNKLLEAVKETYDKMLKKNRGYRYAIARTFDEFENLGKVEDLIVHTAIGEILLTHEQVFIGNSEAIKKELKNYHIHELENELTKEEIDQLLEKIEKVLQGIENVKIDYSPRTDGDST